MPDLAIPALSPVACSSAGETASNGSETAKARDAAQQFEALLLAQILRTVRESSHGTDDAGECATDFAEQQFARVLAQQGGLGLAPLIAAGLERKPAAALPPGGSSG